jgi:hypothetical protein
MDAGFPFGGIGAVEAIEGTQDSGHLVSPV